MKFLVDLFPVLLFFAVYKFAGIYVATAAAIGIAFLQVIYSYMRHRKVEGMQFITLVLLALLGGATLLFHNELFIKWKPTALDWAFALAFLGTQFFTAKPLTQRMLEKNIQLPQVIWNKLNISWVVFFGLMGAANLFVVYHFSTSVWVNFKLFGMLGLTLLFVISQAFFLARYVDRESS